MYGGGVIFLVGLMQSSLPLPSRLEHRCRSANKGAVGQALNASLGWGSQWGLGATGASSALPWALSHVPLGGIVDPRTCLPPHSLVLQQTMQAGRGPEVASLWGPLLPGWGGRGWARAELCIRKPEPARCPGAGGGCWGLRSACRRGGREGPRLRAPPPHPGPGGPRGTTGDYGDYR